MNNGLLQPSDSKSGAPTRFSGIVDSQLRKRHQFRVKSIVIHPRERLARREFLSHATW
jgi:hypothetical protein